MKAVILAGGKGTRLSEHTQLIPKPLVHVGSKPILLHIIDIYVKFGVTEFVILLGYKSELIKDYFRNLNSYLSDIKIKVNSSEVEVLRQDEYLRNCEFTLVDTGQDTMTGGRLKRIQNYILPGEDFFLTYGDAVANVDLNELLKLHKSKNAIATVTGVRPPGRFGSLQFDQKTSKVEKFQEKPLGDGAYINGGFFVLNSQIFERLSGDQSILELEPLINLAKDGKFYTYLHDGYWQCMDTIRDLEILNSDFEKSPLPWLN
jgi:glucose-1-phosphate cytidylyltransferase